MNWGKFKFVAQKKRENYLESLEPVEPRIFVPLASTIPDPQDARQPEKGTIG